MPLGGFFMAKNSKEVQKRADAKRAQDTAENWEMIVYPESAPDDWKNILRGLHVPMFISPLHDKDIHEDGTQKKPHWHVILMFGAKKSKAQMKQITGQLNTVDPIRVQRLSGAVRYLIHKDDPDKFQYSSDEVESFNGANFLEAIACNVDIRSGLKMIFKIVRDEDIRNYNVLLDLLEEMGRDDLWIIATENRTLAVRAYLDDRWKWMKAKEEKEERIRRDKWREADQEIDYLMGVENIVKKDINNALNDTNNTPPKWDVMRDIIIADLVDAGYSNISLDEYMEKRHIDLRKKYNEDTGWDCVNGKNWANNDTLKKD